MIFENMDLIVFAGDSVTDMGVVTVGRRWDFDNLGKSYVRIIENMIMTWYKVGKKKVYMTPSAAQAQGYERVSKYPKSTKFGRQNPITERWNSDEQLVLWRAAWADVANRYLERTGHSRFTVRSIARFLCLTAKRQFPVCCMRI